MSVTADTTAVREPTAASLRATRTVARIPVRAPMTARAVDEPHRAATQLELLFDLAFVVATAGATAELAHRIADGQALAGLAPFLQVFFAIWWAWMNFTWFASAFDTDDVVFRVLTLVQIGGVLLLATGVPAAAEHADYGAITIGYLVMRSSLVAQWGRAALEDPASRATALRYAVGIAVAEVGWLMRLAADESGLLRPAARVPVFVGLVAVELAVPWWAERARPTSWHPHHIAERYGLFAIILLGEGVFAAATGVGAAVGDRRFTASFMTTAVAGLVLLFALWWLYFLEPCGDHLARRRDRSFRWGYGHYGIFAALAAFGAGLEVALEDSRHAVHASPIVVGYAVAIPVSAFLVLTWAVNARLVPGPAVRPEVVGSAASLILLLPLGAELAGPPVVVAGAAAVCTLTIVAAR